MALSQSLSFLRESLRKFTNTQGQTSRVKHTDTDLNDYINKALARLRFLLSQASPDQRFLSSSTVSTVSGTTVYPLSGFTPTAADMASLISIDLLANGTKSWLQPFQPSERAELTSPDMYRSGIPYAYRLETNYLELLPTPTGAWTVTLWYVPTTTQLTTDTATVDTVNRLDDFVIGYAGRFIATKDKSWDLLGECKALCAELEGEILMLGRTKDINGSSRVVEVYMADRWGRRRWRRA